jgi:hypothetical protein
MKTLLFAVSVLSTLFFFVGLAFGQSSTADIFSDGQSIPSYLHDTPPGLISFEPDEQGVVNGSIGIFADNAGLDCNLPGSGTVTYYFVHVNAIGATASQWAAPKPACLTGTRLADLPVFAINLGNTEEGITVGYGLCKVGTFHIMSAMYQVTNASDCCYFSVIPDPNLESGHIEIPDCLFNLTYGDGQAGVVNSTSDCPCGSISCPQAALTLQGYRTVSWEDPLWTVQVEVRNSGPGPAKNVSVTMQQDIPWLYIPDANCYYGEILSGESSLGGSDSYTFDLTYHPGGNFNVWFDVSYEDTCGYSHLVRLDPEFGLDNAPGPSLDTIIACRLGQNYPNPFNPTTTIPFFLPEDSDVRLSVFDSQGKVVRVLVSNPMPAGSREVIWDGRDTNGTLVSSGLYFCQLKASGTVETRKLLLLK